MRRSIMGLLLVALTTLALPTYALSIWHSNTYWAGQGQCSAVFTFDSGLEEIKSLEVKVSAVNKQNEMINLGTMQLDTFGGSSAERYANAFIESEDVCDDELTIFIDEASAIINGEYYDLVQMRKLQIRKFKPFELNIY